jgi:hypothetical protein
LGHDEASARRFAWKLARVNGCRAWVEESGSEGEVVYGTEGEAA